MFYLDSDLKLHLDFELKEGLKKNEAQLIIDKFLKKFCEQPIDLKSKIKFREQITLKLLKQANNEKSFGYWEYSISKIKVVFGLEPNEITNLFNQSLQLLKDKSFRIQLNNEKLVYYVTPVENNEKTMSFLGRLFYGIRCLYAHGSHEKTLNTGALSTNDKPQKSDIKFKIDKKHGLNNETKLNINDEDHDKLVEYVWNLWDDACTKKESLDAAFEAANNVSQFMYYMVYIVGTICEIIDIRI